MGKVLLIDSLSPIGHVNFNNIHISALVKAGYKVECAFPRGYSKLLTLPKDITIHEYDIDKSINWRIGVLKFLRLVKKRLNLKNFDHIIHSSYDDVSLLLANYPHSILIDHNNLSKLHSSIRKLIFKMISCRHLHVSLSNEIKDFLNSKKIKNILIQHGLVSPFCVENIHNFSKDLFTYEIFIPSAGSSDINELRKIFRDNNFITFLENNNIRITLSSKDLKSECKNIHIIERRLDNDEYINLFVNSNLIWLPYPKTFENRVSGVLMEAIANQKDVIIPNIKAFNQYRYFINNNSYYDNIDDMVSSIREKIDNPSPINLTAEIKQSLSPDYSVLDKLQIKE